MHNYTRDDIFHIVEEEDVAFIRLQFTDIFGTMKNMAVTVGQLEKALDNRCMFDVSSLEGVADEEESDMYLYPVRDIRRLLILCLPLAWLPVRLRYVFPGRDCLYL